MKKAAISSGSASQRKRDWGMTMRRWHRYVSTVMMVFLTYLSLTGIALAIDKYTVAPDEPEEAAALAPVSKDKAMTLVREAVIAARTRAPQNAASFELHVRMVAAGPVATANFGREAQVLTIDPVAGVVTGSRPPAAGPSPFRLELHTLLEALHRGSILGIPGQAINFMGGVAFVFFAISGIWTYLDMLRRRRKAGKPALFWQK